jgi:hypothetical protein
VGGADAATGNGGSSGSAGKGAGGRSSGGSGNGGAGGRGTGGALASGGSGTGGAGGGSPDGGPCVKASDCAGTADCLGGKCAAYQACANSLGCTVPDVCDPVTHRCAQCAAATDCATGQDCAGGHCVVVTPCASDKQCTPQGQLCDLARGRCVDCLAPTDCTTGKVCVAGACSVAICVPSTLYCDGSTVRRCDALGQSGVTAKVCPTGQYCDPATAACKALLCAPGSKGCNGAITTTCNAEGTGYLAGGTDCSQSGRSCALGDCKSCGTAGGTAAVKLVEVSTGTPDYVVLQNTGGCAVDLAGMALSFHTSNTTGLSSEFTVPPYALGPGERVAVVDAGTPARAGLIVVSANIDWAATYGGYALLCSGPCGTAANVVDAFAFQGGLPPPPLPSPVTFAPPLTGLTTTNEPTQAFLRGAFTGTNPTFQPSDWALGAASHPTCPATQPTGICSTTTASSCQYGAVTCTCTLSTFTFSYAWACR